MFFFLSARKHIELNDLIESLNKKVAEDRKEIKMLEEIKTEKQDTIDKLKEKASKAESETEKLKAKVAEKDSQLAAQKKEITAGFDKLSDREMRLDEAQGIINSVLVKQTFV